MNDLETQSDILIVGAGLAGLFTALRLAPLNVSVMAAAPLSVGASSAWAQGGIAAVMSEGDTVEAHQQDTMIAGCYLNDPEIVRIMTSEASLRIYDLLAMGIHFDQDDAGKFIQGREAAHSSNRIVKVGGDSAGRYVIDRLTENVLKSSHITLHEPYIMFDFAYNDHREMVGIYARKLGDHKPILFTAKKIILATGGIGHLYENTTNPYQIRGEGFGIAARHGIRLKDSEFVQFHPTALNIDKSPAPLATEALRGEGAILINNHNERFMQSVHPDKELAPRDIVARSVATEYQKGNQVFLDTRYSIGSKVLTEFPTVSKSCLDAGIDPVTMPIPVKTAQHYHMGGIYTDAFGKTSAANLFAVGEVAGTGAHGANRLASNSLLEAVVFAARAAEFILNTDIKTPSLKNIALPIQVNRLYPKQSAFAQLRHLMTAYCGLLRDEQGLIFAKKSIIALDKQGNHTAPFTNYAHASLAIIDAALSRKQSIGAHYRTDMLEKIII
ncbi:MAG: L-aspartate oxidase [Alphaproteobacteria bacterium]|jgi:L-aspartate oxidase